MCSILKNKDLLYKEYVINKKSVATISEEYCIYNAKRIRQALKKYNIQKRCNYCGNIDNLVIDKLGRVYDYCYDCQKILAGKGGQKYWDTVSEEKRQNHLDKIHNGCKEYYKSLTEEERQWHSNLSSKTCKDSWENATSEKREKRINRIKESKENTPIEILEDRYRRISESNKGRISPMKDKGLFKHWIEKYGKEKAEELEYNRVQKMLKTNKEKGTIRISKKEKECFEYIKNNIDYSVQTQVKYNKWYIDFYLPKYDLYVEFNGDYWHGYTLSPEKLIQTKHGKAILKKIESDKEKINTIKNLIVIKESEFIKNKEYLDFLIFKNTPRYLTNRLGGII